MDFNMNQPVPFDSEKTEKIGSLYKQIIELLGEDVDREGLIKTPERVSKAMQFFDAGIRAKSGRNYQISHVYREFPSNGNCERY